MHMNDLTLDELKRNHAQSKSCAERSKLNGLHGTAGYYSRMAEALQARINELEAACGGRCNAEYNPCAARVVANKLKKDTP